MGKKIRRDGQYSGLIQEGRCPNCGGEQPWPELLIGTEEIGGYLRIHPDTAKKWFGEGRLPGGKDGRGRWMTTRRLLDEWVLKMAIRARRARSTSP